MGYKIGICGDSGSGKTTLSKALGGALGDCLLLECDRYHMWRRGHPKWKEFTHLDINANHVSMMSDDVNDLVLKKSITRCDYDHTTGRFTDPEEIFPKDNIIVCGLHSLYCDDVFDLKVYMDTHDNLRTFWKISRDTKNRGHTFKSVKDQIERRRGDFEEYVKPQKKKADVIVNFYSEVEDRLDLTKGIGTKMTIMVGKDISENLIYRSYSKEGISVTVTNMEDRRIVSFLSYPTSDVRYYYDYILVLLKSILLIK
jgi:uridine kinase